MKLCLASLAGLATAALAGCLTCQPLLDVRHCAEYQCHDPTDAAVFVDWLAEHAEAWPQVHALIESTPEGDHAHQQWSAQMQDDFWAYFNVSGDAPEVFATYEGETYRIRVLSCD